MATSTFSWRRDRVRGGWGASVLLVAVLAGCSVGSGTGEASGRLFVLNCSPKGDYCDSTGACGTLKTPAAYDLGPSFFAGEPIESLNRDLNGNEWVGNESRVNRVTIRLQRSGRQVENNDTLFVDVVNSFEVARCVRGRESLAKDGTRQHDYLDSYCFRAGATGPARVRVSVVGGLIHASLSPRDTCTRPAIATADDEFTPGVAAEPVPGGAYRSWIELKDFGGASQDDIADPLARTEVDRNFRIGLNQRLNATAFSFVLEDKKVETARVSLQPVPIPSPDIGGSLTGLFDFNLARGQGAQMFP
jgi:hypothetical protein